MSIPQDRPPPLSGLTSSTGSRSPTIPILSPTTTTTTTSSTRSPNPSSTSPRLLSPSQTSSSLPPWARRPALSSSERRLSSVRRSPYASASNPPDAPLHIRLLRGAISLGRQGLRLFFSLSPLYQALVLLAGVVAFVLGVLGLVYSHRIFAALAPVAQSWRALPGGWVLCWLLVFACAFPPMIGYSTAVTVAGFVYDFPAGWPLVATATVAGSTVAFLTSRGVFSGYVHRLVGRDRRFVALGQVLRRDGLVVLAMIRFCPLPYSLSNGFLATVPSIRPLGFAAATACATPKLAVHVFIGSRLAKLAESGDKMSSRDRAINYAGMIFGGLLGMIVGLLIYRRTMARAAELAAEGADLDNEELLAGGPGGPGGDGDPAEGGYFGDDIDDVDAEIDREDARLMRADTDAAALMDDDDISLWETEGVEGASGYRDSWDDEEAAAAVGSGTGKKSDAATAMNGNGVGNGAKR